MLGVVASMYWQAPVTVKNGDRLGPSFNTTRGVKQGDPLFPLIFGLFIDRVERWWQDRAGDCGVPLRPNLVRLLLHADDLTLLASTPQQLQALLDCLRAFCKECCLEVNVPKWALVVFGQSCQAC